MITVANNTPKPRLKTPEENAVQVLIAYESSGYDAALSVLKNSISEGKLIQRELIAVHSILAAMQFELGKTVNIIQILANIENEK